ncbi:MAG: hypothetical protein V4508_11235 [Pseudomonadota bacterium]
MFDIYQQKREAKKAADAPDQQDGSAIGAVYHALTRQVSATHFSYENRAEMAQNCDATILEMT